MFRVVELQGIEMSFGQFLKLAPPMGTTTMVVSMFILWFE
jgi:Na+/H+ antiporter NhaD/arsenite permease-like protein